MWSQVPVADRRRILRAVNRGQVLQSRREAAMAVVMARRQQRFWRFAWLLGPVLAVPLAFLLGIEGAADITAYALLGGGILLTMSVFYVRRARRAERGNTERAVHGRRP